MVVPCLSDSVAGRVPLSTVWRVPLGIPHAGHDTPRDVFCHYDTPTGLLLVTHPLVTREPSWGLNQNSRSDWPLSQTFPRACEKLGCDPCMFAPKASFWPGHTKMGCLRVFVSIDLAHSVKDGFGSWISLIWLVLAVSLDCVLFFVQHLILISSPFSESSCIYVLYWECRPIQDQVDCRENSPCHCYDNGGCCWAGKTMRLHTSFSMCIACAWMYYYCVCVCVREPITPHLS